jgi:hypothetical protein
MAAAVLTEAPPHVHHNLHGLNRFDRDTAFTKVIAKLPTGGAEMLDRMHRVAGALEILTKFVYLLRVSSLDMDHGCNS